MSKHSQMNDHGDVIIDMESLEKAQKNAKNEQSTKKLKETQSIQTNKDRWRTFWIILKITSLAVTVFIVCYNYCFDEIVDQQSINETQRKLEADAAKEIIRGQMIHEAITSAGKAKEFVYDVSIERVKPDRFDQLSFRKDGVKYLDSANILETAMKAFEGKTAEQIREMDEITAMTEQIEALAISEFRDLGYFNGFKDGDYVVKCFGPAVRSKQSGMKKHDHPAGFPHVDWGTLSHAESDIFSLDYSGKGKERSDELQKELDGKYKFWKLVNIWVSFVDVDKNSPLAFLKKGLRIHKPEYIYKPMKRGEAVLFNPFELVHGSPHIEDGERISSEWRCAMMLSVEKMTDEHRSQLQRKETMDRLEWAGYLQDRKRLLSELALAKQEKENDSAGRANEAKRQRADEDGGAK